MTDNKPMVPARPQQQENDAARLKKLGLALGDSAPPPPVSEYAGAKAGGDFMARITEALNIGHKIATTMGKVGDYDREETDAFVSSLEAQVKEWATNLVVRKEKNLAELKRILGDIK